MTPKKARIKDLGSLVSESIGTDNRVLHNRKESTEETMQKVQRILKGINYSPIRAGI